VEVVVLHVDHQDGGRGGGRVVAVVGVMAALISPTIAAALASTSSLARGTT
jgi:hypothetical protein